MPKELQFSGIVGDDLNAEYVRNILAGVEGEEILVHLYTPGGFVDEGMEIYNIISRFKSKKNVVLGGVVASIGSVIAMAFDKISVTKASSFMIHNAWDIIAGDAEDFRKKAEKLEKLNNQIAGILADRSGKSIENIKMLMKEETWYFGQEIVDAGFADELIEAKDSGAGNLDKQSAVALAREKVKNTMAALLVKNKPEFNAESGIENKSKREESMTKNEMLDKLKVMKESGELSLSEITDSFKLEKMLVTEDHTSALNIVNKLKEMNINDPIKTIQELQKRQKADSTSVRNAKLSEVFGVSEKDSAGNEKNLVLQYAIDKAGEKSGNELDQVIENLKTDPIAVQLQKEKADPHSETNLLGVLEGKDKKDNPENKTGIKSFKL